MMPYDFIERTFLGIYFYYKEKHFWITLDQVSANRGPDSTFTVKANTKTMCPKSSRFPLVTMMDRGRVIQPRVKY